MKLLLERTDTISSVEKEKIEEDMSVYDQLWEEGPMIQKMRGKYQKKGLQEGLQKGLQEGEILALRRALVNIVRIKYPELTEFAQQQAGHLDKPEMLDLIMQKVVAAPNVDTARWLLE